LALSAFAALDPFSFESKQQSGMLEESGFLSFIPFVPGFKPVQDAVKHGGRILHSDLLSQHGTKNHDRRLRSVAAG
jgi:hypothetical protein